MEPATVTFITGIITCILGIATFVVGMNSRAKSDGRMLEKINQCITGIEEIKNDLKENTRSLNTHDKLISSIETRVSILEKDVESLFSRINGQGGV